MATTLSSARTFSATVEAAPNGGIAIALGFDPAAAWGERLRYHVGGAIGGRPVRGVVAVDDPKLVLGPAWCRDGSIKEGDRVTVTLALEGPETHDLGDDLAAALDAEPAALAFFQDLAQFYRKAYLTWINGTKRKPQERARRIAEVVRLLKAGKKGRPR
ncbi:MAG: YdeI/OmpD-associated family protein [Bauldia sp.]|nr:YdeI/OmpD-associated family protein [Bauldia sp.]